MIDYLSNLFLFLILVELVRELVYDTEEKTQ